MIHVTTTEWCNVCTSEDTISTKRHNLGGIYFCRRCHTAMPLCSLCDLDKVNCYECSLAIACKKLNENRVDDETKNPYYNEYAEL